MPDHPLGPGDRVIVAGASGLIGRALVASLRRRGVTVTTLVRGARVSSSEVVWDPADDLAPETLQGARAVVVLNGASIGRLPWTPAYRSELLWSRLTPVRTVVTALDALEDPPHLVTASAVGFYGSRPGEDLNEESAAGEGFLADLCVEIESAALRIADRTTVTPLRIAPVMHVDGVLKPLMLLTKAGLAGPLGRGTQVWPWVTRDDVIGAIEHVIAHDVSGPVNVVGPTRATADDIGFSLAVRMNRPFVLRAPAVALRAALGAAADGLLLSDADVHPTALERGGFVWRHPTVEDAIAHAVPRG